jgi:osmotically-inducible protein OsmY
MKTDSEIQKDVIAELDWQPSVDATRIGVAVDDAVVTLSGSVGSYAEKYDAEHAAQRVAGVEALVVNIEVQLPASRAATDAEVARSAADTLRCSTGLPVSQIRPVVEKGWLTLSGEVDWDYQRQDAARSVRYLAGIRGITNDILIKPVASAKIIKADIESALKRCASSDGRQIRVDIAGDEVTLTGTVHSNAERELARQSAWAAPGVRNVFDQIAIAV